MKQVFNRYKNIQEEVAVFRNQFVKRRYDCARMYAEYLVYSGRPQRPSTIVIVAPTEQRDDAEGLPEVTAEVRPLPPPSSQPAQK